MTILDRAEQLLGTEDYRRLCGEARQAMRDNPPSEAQLDEMARLLLLLCDSADRNLARTPDHIRAA